MSVKITATVAPLDPASRRNSHLIADILPIGVACQAPMRSDESAGQMDCETLIVLGRWFRYDGARPVLPTSRSTLSTRPRHYFCILGLACGGVIHCRQ